MKKILLYLTLILVFPLQLLAFTIKGKVVDVVTKEPLANVHIAIVDKSDGTTTFDDGTFNFEYEINSNKVKVQISCLGYKNLEFVLNEEEKDFILIELQPETVSLNKEITVTATGHKTESFLTSEATSIISKHQLLRSSPHSAIESLLGVTGVWMQKTNHGGGSPFIRGLTGNQSLILIDGIRLNNSTFRYGPNQYFNTIDINTIKQIEVIRGNGSTLYGSDALGGVINVLTDETSFTTRKNEVHATLHTKMMSHGMEKSLFGKGIFQSKKFSLLASGSYSDFGDIYAGQKLEYEKPSGYRQYGVMLKSKFIVADNIVLQASFQRLNQLDINRFDQVSQRGFQYYKFDPQIHQLAYVRGEGKFKNRFYNKLLITAAYQFSNEVRKKKKRESDNSSREQDKVKTISFSAKVSSQFNNYWSSVSGVELYFDRVFSDKKELDSKVDLITLKRGLYANDATAQNFAIFSKHKIVINDHNNINFGLRYNTFYLDLKDKTFGNISITPSSFVGDLSYQFFYKNTQFILSANSAFRAPNINDVSSFGSFDYGVEIPSKELEPEKTYTVELGVKHRRDDLSMSFFLFNTWLNNQIIRVKSNYNGDEYYDNEKVYKKENINKSIISGVESQIGYNVSKKFSIKSNLTWLYGRDISNDQPMRRIPPLNGLVSLIYNENNFYLENEYLFATKQDRLSQGDIDDHRIPIGGTPGFFIMNIKLGYLLKNFSIYTKFQNILDEGYRMHGSGIDGYGRSAWIALNFNV